MSEKVQVVIFNESNNKMEVLLLQTNPARGSFWQNITGGKETFDSSNIHAAKREIREEIGVDLSLEQIHNLHQSFKYYDSNRDIEYNEHLFTAKIKQKDIKISPEHIDYRWTDANLIKPTSYRYRSSYEAFLMAYDLFNEEKKK